MIDPNSEIFDFLLWRDACDLFQIEDGSMHFFKDISRLGRDLKRTIIVDNSLTAFAKNVSYHFNLFRLITEYSLWTILVTRMILSLSFW